VYLTGNLDSLLHSFAEQGFEIAGGPLNGTRESGTYTPLAHDWSAPLPQVNKVLLPSGQRVEFQSPPTNDTSDWRWRAVAAFGTRVAGIILRVRDIPGLARAFDSLNIPHGPVERSASGLSLGLLGPEPLDVAFVSGDSAPQLHVSNIPPNRFTRISWLLLTASEKSEVTLRLVFTVLGLTKSHEGCCDYWMLGPPENRVGIRFELPTTTFTGLGEWLSIEPGGIVFAY